MSTRCRIGMAMPDGKIKSIYCHFDGYPEGVGAKLKKHYTSPEKVEKLLELGDISSLGEDYDEELAKKSWGLRGMRENLTEEEWEKMRKITIPYKDRGRTRVDARVDEDVREYIKKIGDCWEDYTYLFTNDYSGVYRWEVCECPWFKEF